MLHWTSLDTGIVLVGVLAATACAVPGSFLVLKRMSMMGDAISHAVLPGLAIAFLLTGSRDSVPMFVGAILAGVLTAAITQWVTMLGKVEESASMGVVFTSLFAVGLLLIVQAADSVDLDPGCVLYGAIELTPLDTVHLLGVDWPRAAVKLAVVLIVNVGVVAALFKELKISTFDPALATSMGVSARAMHYLLMTLVAVTTVAAFESVGSILVIAMLIVPAATAQLLTDRLGLLLLLSVVVAAASAVGGHVAALIVPGWFGFADTSTAGMMAVVAGLLFALAVLAAPRYGVIGQLLRRAGLAVRIAAEDVLGLLFRLEEKQLTGATARIPELRREAVGAHPLVSRLALWRLQRRGEVARAEAGYRLTDAGRDRGRQLIRGHRLWESYLAKHFPLPATALHVQAERMEHYLDDRLQAALHTDVGPLQTDPMGKPIPPQERGDDNAPPVGGEV